MGCAPGIRGQNHGECEVGESLESSPVLSQVANTLGRHCMEFALYLYVVENQ